MSLVPKNKEAVMAVFDSGIIAQGSQVKAFEEAFAEMCDVKHTMLIIQTLAGLANDFENGVYIGHVFGL